MAEVLPLPSLEWGWLALVPWVLEGLPSAPTLGHPPIHKEVAVAFWARAEHPNLSHRSQQSVPEAFSAPLELSQPLSGLVDGSISLVPFPFPCPSLTVETPLRGAPSPAFRGLSSQTTSVQGCQLPLPPMPSFLSLDYGILPKHPWPRGPRPLLSRAQQRKRDGPDLAEYYYDAHL